MASNTNSGASIFIGSIIRVVDCQYKLSRCSRRLLVPICSCCVCYASQQPSPKTLPPSAGGSCPKLQLNSRFTLLTHPCIMKIWICGYSAYFK